MTQQNYGWIALLLLMLPDLLVAQTKSREQKVREDRSKVEQAGFWIYNDLPLAFQRAEATKKPLIVVLRCIPCEECVKLDDELVDQDPAIRPLLEQFVCVRVVATNGLDLSLFQYDTDQSFAVFMLNADKTIYGRFGTRSHRTDWLGDVSLAGLRVALEGALELHRDYPANKLTLAGKRGPAPLFPTPEKFPSLAEKYTSSLNYEGNVVQSCIHCHQIGDAQRQFYRDQQQPLPEEVLFPYPHPKSLGLVLDPHERATVKEVSPQSLAAAAGFQAGDRIKRLAGQPLLSMADVQWVLHITPAGSEALKAEVERNGQQFELVLKLSNGWRRLGDLSWRSSSWGLRRMTTGGMFLEPLPEHDRQRLNISAEKMALFAKHVGEYGAHAAAKKAGFRKGDVVIEFDGRSDLLREADLFLYGTTRRKAEERVPVVILRDGQRIELNLPMQK